MQAQVQRFDVHWYGPFELVDGLANLKKDLPSDLNENHVLYMICGTHGLYGRNVPLYIGKTERSISARLKEHTWISEEPDPVRVYTACIGEFISWEFQEQTESYPPLDRQIIEAVESLLIVAHQPAYNSRSKEQRTFGGKELAIFNTGRRGTLYPEVSTAYWAQATRERLRVS